MWFVRAVSFGAAMALAGVLTAISLSIRNVFLEKEVAERQQSINQAMALGQVHAKMVNSLALLAERNDDDQLRGLLAEQSIKLNPGKVQPKQPQKPGQRQ